MVCKLSTSGKFIRTFYKGYSISAYDTLEAISTSLTNVSSSLFDGDISHHQTIGLARVSTTIKYNIIVFFSTFLHHV
jgi:hypothetical protein